MNQIDCLDKGFVRLVDSMGDDARIVQAARVSYGDGTKSPSSDKALIDYLIRHKHTSPLEKVHFEFHVKTPLFVARQWMRHRTGSFNEVSARYSEMPAEFYEPDSWREQSSNNKQGSGEDLVVSQDVEELFSKSMDAAYLAYEALLDSGVAREMARMVLPVSLYTEFYWTIDLHNLFHFVELRSDKHAQQEIRVYSDALLELIEPIVPNAIESWKNHQLNSARFSEDELDVLRVLLAENELQMTQSTAKSLLRNNATRAREFMEKLYAQ